MRYASVVSVALAAIGLVQAHWEVDYTPDELARRQVEHEERIEMAKACGPEIAKYEARRKAKRDLAKRGIHDPSEALIERQATGTASALAPHVTAIQNNSCVLAPEVTEGPYYIKNDLIRSDLRETQKGTSLFLDIGVMDITTCKPAANVFVELWACNATGRYSSFTTTDFPRSVARSDNMNFLRGGYYTNANGVVELATIYPGYYTSRTPHIHVMIHTDVKTNANGTIVSTGGGLRHIGQIFFQESDNDMVFSQASYKTDQIRTYNKDDSIFRDANARGYSSYAQISKLGSSMDEGLLGIFTIGFNPKSAQRVMSTEFFDPNWKPRAGGGGSPGFPGFPGFPGGGFPKREEGENADEAHSHDEH